MPIGVAASTFVVNAATAARTHKGPQTYVAQAIRVTQRSAPFHARMGCGMRRRAHAGPRVLVDAALPANFGIGWRIQHQL